MSDNQSLSCDVHFDKKEFSIVGDALYLRTLAEAPLWLKAAIEDQVDQNNSNFQTQLENYNNNLTTAINQLEASKNTFDQYIAKMITDEEAFILKVDELQTSVNNNDAAIRDLLVSYATEEYVVSTTTSILNASLNDGDIKSAIESSENTLATQYGTLAERVNTLESTYEFVDEDITGTADAVQDLQVYTGYGTTGGTPAVISESSFYTELNNTLDSLNEDILANADAVLSIDNRVSVNENDIANVGNSFMYDSVLQIGSSYYYSGFGLESTGIGDGTVEDPFDSEFWINAEKFKFTNSTKSGSVTPFSIDASGTSPQVTFNGLVTFGNNQTGTIDEAIASSVDQIAVGDKNINITDNLIPTSSLVGDSYNAGYQFIGDPTKSMATGLGDFSEAQVILDSNDEVYSPYVDEYTIPYYYRFGIYGVTDLSAFTITTIDDSDNVTYHDVSITLESDYTDLDDTKWYEVDGIINPSGGSSGTSGRIFDRDKNLIGTVNNFTLPSDARKIVLGWTGPCTISRMKLSKITADTLTGSVATLDYVNSNLSNYVLPEEVADAVNNNTTTIDGSKITTGSVEAAKISTSELSAISSNLGTITGGSMNINDKFSVSSDGTTTIKSGSTGARLEIKNDVIKVYDDGGNLRVKIGDLSA